MSKPTPTLDSVQPQILHSPTIPSGSGLARESVRSVDIDAECADPFVSKPTPTLDRGQPQILHSPTIPSGSGLAREDVRSVDIDAECADPFVSKPTPTLGLRCFLKAGYCAPNIAVQ
ncbi:hypothetical protein E3Z29_19885 [Pseudomonas sp. S150]|nr:hypothetical protein E3Z29_19885 [Pseudomonas sp. S150]